MIAVAARTTRKARPSRIAAPWAVNSLARRCKCISRKAKVMAKRKAITSVRKMATFQTTRTPSDPRKIRWMSVGFWAIPVTTVSCCTGWTTGSGSLGMFMGTALGAGKFPAAPSPSAPPLQRHRTADRVAEFPGFSRVEPRLLQLEVPLRGPVGVIDEHQVRVVLQALGLLLHGFAVLLDELGKHELQQVGTEGQPAEQVPCRDHVDTASASGDGRDCGQGREPVL